MSFRIDQIRRIAKARRRALARAEDGDAPVEAGLPVPISGPAPAAASAPLAAAEIEAHLIGQEGQRRGLRAGQPLIDAARKLYSAVEWSGARDRRSRKGRRARADV